jgi:copper chaperone NosL
MIDRRTLLLGLAAALTACGEQRSANDPPKIAYGKDLCARCRMIISDERYAAGLVDPEGDQLTFDDIGEMIATVQGEGLQSRRVWVSDYESRAWVDGTQAWYAVSPSVMTPMGTGVTAFETREAAETFAAANEGTVMAWTEMLETWTIAR